MEASPRGGRPLAEPASFVELMRVLFSVCIVALNLAVAAYLSFSPGASVARRALALLFVAVAFEDITLVVDRLQLAPLGGEAPTGVAARHLDPLWFVKHDFQILHNLALVGFLAVYPRVPRLRSWHALAIALPALAFGVGALAWVADKSIVWADWPGGTGQGTFLYWMTIRDGYARAWLFPLVVSALWRARELKPREARAVYVLVPFVCAFTFGGGLTWLRDIPLAFLAGGNPLALPVPAGWSLGEALFFQVMSLGTKLAVVGLVAVMVVRLRVWSGALLLVTLAALAVPLGLTGMDWWSAGFLFAPIAAMYVIGRYSAFGIEASKSVVPWGVAALTFSAVFVMVNTVTVLLSTHPFASAIGVLTGFGAGLACAALMVPHGLAFLRMGALEGEDSQTRVNAYRAALQDGLAQGLDSPTLSRRLLAIRTELGISDRDHALMELTLRSSGGSRATRAARRLEPGTLFLNRYRVVRLLGEGGAGATWLCQDEQVGRPAVVKTLRSPEGSAEGLQAVLREARAIGALRHPQVVTLYDIERVGDEAFTVMEYLEGGSLADRLRTGRLDRAAFRTIACDLLEGLGAVHAAGLVHRDIKPGNVLLSGEGRAKLADFGVAHIPGFESTMMPRAHGAAVGTIRFMSPEQARGRSLTHRSDLFSAAATLYEAWTGRPHLAPKADETAAELQVRAAEGRRFEGGDGLTPGLRAWFAQGLDPDAGGRFGSAAEMRTALLGALDGLDLGRGPAGPARARAPADASGPAGRGASDRLPG